MASIPAYFIARLQIQASEKRLNTEWSNRRTQNLEDRIRDGRQKVIDQVNEFITVSEQSLGTVHTYWAGFDEIPKDELTSALASHTALATRCRVNLLVLGAKQETLDLVGKISGGFGDFWMGAAQDERNDKALEVAITQITEAIVGLRLAMNEASIRGVMLGTESEER